jgi:cytochrome b
MSLQRILVWDVPTRLFHWILALSFFGALATADSERRRDLHILFGVTMLVLIAFRLLWGVVGTRHVRFASFAYGPRAVLRYLTSLATLTSPRYVGHTPAGSWAIWLMLALGVAVGVTGYASYAPIAREWLEELHGVLAWALLGVVIFHVAGVLVSSLLHRENLTWAMITGEKRGAPGEAIAGSRWLMGVLLAALVLALWLKLVPIPGLDGGALIGGRDHRSGVASEKDD